MSIFVIAGIAFIVTKWVFPGRITTLGENLLLATTAIGGAAAIISGFKDAVDLFQDSLGVSDRRGGWGPGGYGKKYLEHIYYRHRNFDVKGLSTQGPYTLELNQVFVELSLTPRPPHEVSSNPIALPASLQAGRHTIWEFLQGESEGVQNFALIGPPGSGKTTLLKHMALALSRYKAARMPGAPRKLPVLLHLGQYAAAIAGESDGSPYTLEEAIQKDLRQWGKAAPPGWFARRLEEGECLALLDGLDEVAEGVARRQVVAWVERQMVAYPRCQFVITSRPHGYRSNPLNQVTQLEVQPFDSQQQQRFIENWYLANEIMSQQKDDAGVRMDAQAGAADLRQRLQSAPALADLAVNPLLLIMIATVHRYRSSLPGRRVELYAEICEVFLGKRQQAKGVSLDLTPAQRQRALQPLAWEMMEKQVRNLTAERAAWVIKPILLAVDPKIQALDFLKQIENESGLLLELENGHYGFAHLTFQEYLAAAHARDQGLLAELLPYVADSWWHETLRLYAAQADATAIVEACLGTDGAPQVESLLLAMDCDEEAREIDPPVRARVQQTLSQAVEETETGRLVAEARLQRRLRCMLRVNETTAVDTSLVTHAEYQLFLDEMRAKEEYLQPDHWSGYRFPPGSGDKPVVGVRPSDAQAFCTWLSQHTGGEVQYRLPQAREAMHIQTYSIDGPLGYWCQVYGEFELEMTQGKSMPLSSTKLQEYFDPNPVHAHVHNLRLARARAIALELTLDNILDHGLDYGYTGDGILALNFVIDCACALVWSLDLDLALALAVNLDLELAYAIARTIDHAFDLDHARRLVLTRAGTLVHKYTLNLALDYGLTFSIAISRALDRAHALNLDRIRAIDRARARILTRALTRAPLPNNFYFIWSLNAFPFVAGYLLWIVDLAEQQFSWFEKQQQKKLRRWKSEVRLLADEYLQVFVDLCNLQERRKGELPAFEGILLVRERRLPADDSSTR